MKPLFPLVMTRFFSNLFVFFLLFFFSFSVSAQTPISLPYTGTNDVLVDNNGDGIKTADFKFTLAAEGYLHLKVDRFVGEGNGISYDLFADPAMTNAIDGNWIPSYEQDGEHIVTQALPAGDYYLRWTNWGQDYTHIAWTVEALPLSVVKDYTGGNYSAALGLGKTTGKLSRAAGTPLFSYLTTDWMGNVSTRVMMGSGYTFKAEGGKLYKVTLQANRKHTAGYAGLSVGFLKGGTLSGNLESDTRKEIDFSFEPGQASLTVTHYFTPAQTETLRAYIAGTDFNDELTWSLQIEEVTPLAGLIFQEITLPFDETVTFEANNSTYYGGEQLKGYKFTLAADATVYFYGRNTIYSHSPSMHIGDAPFSAETAYYNKRRLSSKNLTAGTHYVSFSDYDWDGSPKFFIKDDYFVTRLVISTTAGEPTGTPPTVRLYPTTALTTLLNNETTALTLPYITAGSFDRATSALVPAQQNPSFNGWSATASFFSLAKKVTVAAGKTVKAEWSLKGKVKNAQSNLYAYSYNGSIYAPEGGAASLNSRTLSRAGTYWIVATSDQPFNYGDYVLKIYEVDNPPAKPEITVITPSTTPFAITPTATEEEKRLLLDTLSVKGTTAIGDFALPNSPSHWSIAGNTAIYTPVATDDYTIGAGITGSVNFAVPTTTYTVIFNANGGSGTMSAQTVYAGIAQSLTSNTFINGNKVIESWNTAAGGSGTKYMNGEAVTPTANLTLYAQWREAINLPFMTMGEITHITATKATLHATITPAATTPDEYGFSIYEKFYPATPVGNSLTCTVTDLEPNRSYYVSAVCIYNGISYSSAEEYFYTLEAALVVMRPNEQSVTSTTAVVSVEIREGGEEPIADWKFQLSDNQTDWADATMTNKTKSGNYYSATLTGLTPNTIYYVRAVATTTGGGEKAGGDIVLATIPAETVFRDLTVRNITHTSAKLMAEIYEDPAEPITARKFRYKKDTESSWDFTSVTLSGNSFTASLTGLTAGTLYNVKAVVIVEGGAEKTSLGYDFTTLSATTTPATVITKAATDITQTSVTLNGSIDAGDETINNYQFEYRKVGESRWDATYSMGTGEVSDRITTLTANTAYEFRLRAITDGNDYIEGEIMTFTTAYNTVVTTTAATAITQTSATLNGSIDAGTQTITDRRFEYKATSADSWSAEMCYTTAPATTLTGLTAGTTYQYRLVITIGGVKTYSNMTFFATEEGVATVSYTVIFNSNGGTAVATIANVAAGTAITQPANPSKHGYTFGGWYKDAALSNAWNFANGITENMTLYAKWIAPTGVAKNKAKQSKVYSSGNRIIICPAKAQLEVSIYDLSGKFIIATTSTSSEMSFAISPSGIYIVRIGNESTKVVVQ